MPNQVSSVARIVKPALGLLAALLLGACATPSRLQQPAAPDPQTALNLYSKAADGIELSLQRVIVRNAPDSWVKEAGWDEYQLSLRNDAGVAVSVQSVELMSDLVGSATHTVSPDGLASQTEKNTETMKSIGRGFVIGYAGLMTGALLFATAAGYAVLTPILPVAVMVGGVAAYRSQRQASEDRAVIEYELARRGLRLPAELTPGASTQSSAFFPVTPAPRRLLLRYTVGDVERELVLDLAPQLAQLHLAQGDK